MKLTFVGPPELQVIPSGEYVYVFSFELQTSSGTNLRLSHRYSSLRKLHRKIRSAMPMAAAELPPFPLKYRLARQTPAFLQTRGEALSVYLDALLSRPDLSALPCVKQLMLGDSGADTALSMVATTASAEGKGESSPPATAPVLGLPATGTDSRNTINNDATLSLNPDAQSELSVGAVVGFPSRALQALGSTPPWLALLLAYTLGAVFSERLLAVGCCVLGMIGGVLRRACVLPALSRLSALGQPDAQHGSGAAQRTAFTCAGDAAFDAADASSHSISQATVALQAQAATSLWSGLSVRRIRKANGADATENAEVAQKVALDSQALTCTEHGEAAKDGKENADSAEDDEDAKNDDEDDQEAEHAENATAEGPTGAVLSAGADEWVKVAVPTALEAFKLADEQLRLREQCGWKFYQAKGGIDIYINTELGHDVPMGSVGVGQLPASVGDAQSLFDDEAHRNTLDKLWISSQVLATLPVSCLHLEGHMVESVTIERHLYRSPSRLIAQRESVVVRVRCSCLTTGTVYTIQKSVDAPTVRVTPNFVRLNLYIGAGRISSSEGGCKFEYLTAIDPGGRVPSSIVKTTAPDQSMLVSRLRKLIIRQQSPTP